MSTNNLDHATAWSDSVFEDGPFGGFIAESLAKLDTSPLMAIPIRRWGLASSLTNRGSF